MEINWHLLLSGLPLSSPRGALGWSSVVLVQRPEFNLLVDTGSYGDRALLLSRLAEFKLSPDAIDAVFLTHFHFDHVLNFDLFKNAVFHLSETEINYVTEGRFKTLNDPYVPAVIYQLLSPQIKPFSGEIEILPGLRTVPLPGHTPGMTGLLLEQDRVLIAGDGIKNAREYQQQQPPPAFASAEQALQSYQRAAQVAETIIPGHDNPFRLTAEREIDYLACYQLQLNFAGPPSAEPKISQQP